MAYVLTYINSFDDYVAMIQAKRLSGRAGFYGPYIAMTLFFLAFVVLGHIWDGGSIVSLFNAETMLLILAGMLAVIVLVALINYIFLRGIYRLVFRRFALSGKELTIKLDDEGLHWQGNGFSGACHWSKVQRVVETKDRLFLFISKAEGLLVPRRAVKSDQEFGERVAHVRSHVHD